MRTRLAIAAAAVVVVAHQAQAAPPIAVKAKVVSVRGNRVYLKVDGSRELEAGKPVIVQLGKRKARVKLIASSSKFLLIQKPKTLALAVDQTVRVRGAAEAAAAPLVDVKPAVAVGGGISIGRRAPSLQEFLTKKEPERELVPFSGLPSVEGDEALAEEEQDLPSNDPRGSFEVGADGAYEKRASVPDGDRHSSNVSQTTPYATLRLEVDRLFGSERGRFVIYGTARQPFKGGPDWTSHRDGHLQARLSTLAIELDAAEAAEINSFSDRIELRLGRDEVRGSVEAGVIDGAQLGLRVGPLVGFGFAGVGAATNPRTFDYDTFVWGGGVRFNYAFEHTGSLRISIASAHERWRDEGDRGYLEGTFDAQFGSFGARGAAVYDVYSSLRQNERQRLTTGDLSLYMQVTDSLRFSAGYSERRPVYTAALIQEDLRDLSLIGYLSIMDEAARRNMYAEASFYVPGGFDVRLRGEHYQSRESRNHTGFEFAVQIFDLFTTDRLSFDLRARHRHGRNQRADGFQFHSTEVFALLSYRYLGEVLELGIDVAQRVVTPKEAEERRTAVRLSTDIHPTEGVTLGGYVEAETVRHSRRDQEVEHEDLYLLGLYVRFDY